MKQLNTYLKHIQTKKWNIKIKQIKENLGNNKKDTEKTEMVHKQQPPSETYCQQKKDS